MSNSSVRALCAVLQHTQSDEISNLRGEVADLKKELRKYKSGDWRDDDDALDVAVFVCPRKATGFCRACWGSYRCPAVLAKHKVTGITVHAGCATKIMQKCFICKTNYGKHTIRNTDELRCDECKGVKISKANRPADGKRKRARTETKG